MSSDKLTREEMWARQQISRLDVDYEFWAEKREAIRQMSLLSSHCLFTVDVFKGRYDFASESFADIFGYKLSSLKEIQKEGDLLEERIHPDDKIQLIDRQINHSQFIYSLPLEYRNDYRQTFQFRMLNRKREYINVVSRQQVIQKDKQGKAWMIMGHMDVSPEPYFKDEVKCSVLNLKTGDIIFPSLQSSVTVQLTPREKEILILISQGLLSKEIAHTLDVSIYTIHNHRKNILAKLNVDNAIEAINLAHKMKLLY